MARRTDTRLATSRPRIAALVAALLVAASLVGCGGNPDPYAVIDQARTASYERFQVNLGLNLNVPANATGDFTGSATSVNIDPAWITLAGDIPAGHFYLRVSIPLDAFGQPGQSLGIPFASLELEALLNGSDVYVKSPLLPMALQGGIAGVPIAGDLAGWVRFSGAGDLAALAPMLLGAPGFGFAEDLGAFPLPSPGAVAELKDLLTAMGVTVEYAGTESVEGAELVHLKGGVRIATLAASQPFLAITGMTRDQVQSLVALEGQVGISTEIWVNKANGRLTTLRIDGTNADTPATTVAVILRIAEPAADITFEPPTTFTDIDLSDLIGDQLSGVGAIGGGGAVGPVVPVPQEMDEPASTP